MTKQAISHRILVFQAIAFVSIIVLVWLNEVCDLPYRLLGAPKTPINWKESLENSIVLIALWFLIYNHTKRLIRKIHQLEELLHVCAHCGRVRMEEKWMPFDEYLAATGQINISHGLCPECIRTLYPDMSIE
jgi:hypothetical protein